MKDLVKQRRKKKKKPIQKKKIDVKQTKQAENQLSQK